MSALPLTAPVDVWRVWVPTEPAAKWRDCLFPAERARADRFVFEADRARFTVTRGILRTLLRPYLAGSADPPELLLNPWGKPALPAGEPRFNVTHSGDLALIAIARGADVGIDVEHHAIHRPLDDLARIVFTPKECATLARLQGDDRNRFFFRTWTCKEAVVKAIGGGLSIPVDRLGMEFGERGLVTVHPERENLAPPPWWIREIDVPDGYSAAIAVRADAIRLQVHDWPQGEESIFRPKP